MTDDYSLELVEMDVRTYKVATSNQKVITATYFTSLCTETQWCPAIEDYITEWVGSSYNHSQDRRVTLENETYRYRVRTEEEAYSWWERATKKKAGAR